MTTPRMMLVDLDRAECEKLLESATLGRVGVVVNGRPEIFPVHHAYDRARGAVVFETDARTKLHAALDWPWVAFEVDDTSEEGAGGWSVLVVGRAEEVTDHDEIERVSGLRPRLWKAASPERWLTIVPEKMTGRRVVR